MLSWSRLERVWAALRRHPSRRALLIFGVLVLAACGGSESAEVGPTTTLHPDDQATADGFFALCNDGYYSDNDDFAKTCSGGDGISRWLSDYGECLDGTVLSMRSIPDCGDRGGFARLLPRDYVPQPGGDDVALCNDGNFSNNTDFDKTCSGGDGISRWLAVYGECSDGTVIDMGPSSRCPGGSAFVGLLPDDYDFDAEDATATTVVLTTPSTTTNVLPPDVASAIEVARGALGLR